MGKHRPPQWPVGIAAVAAGFVLLLGGDEDVPAVAVVNRSVGASFIFCGLIAWHRRPDSRTGPLMTLTGFLFLGTVLVGELDFTLGEVTAGWWAIAFVTLVLGFPGGRIRSRLDRLLIGGFVFGTGVMQVVWLLFRPVPDNWLLIAPDAELADAIDTFQRGWAGTLGMTAAIVGLIMWLHAAPPLRRLLLPKLAGALALLVLGVQLIYQLFAGEFIRSGQEVTAVVLVSVPLAFLVGVLQTELAAREWPISSWRSSRRPTRSGSARCWAGRSAIRRSSSSTGCPDSRRTSTPAGGRSHCRRRDPGAPRRRSTATARRSRRSSTTPR